MFAAVMKIEALLLAALLCMPVAAVAELPPYVYIDDARRAPEALRIRVIDVAQRDEGDATIFELVGEVVEVRRSAAGLKPGNRVRIHYGNTRHPPGWVGPAKAPPLSKGAIVPAFIEPHGTEGSTYRLAARGQSFSTWVWEQSADWTLSVELKVNSDSCGGSSEGEPGVSYLKWVGDGHLRVSIWQYISAQTTILEEGAGAVLDGDNLQLTFGTQVEEIKEGQAYVACSRPVSLRYEVRGLPRRDYRVTFRGVLAP